MHSEKAFNIPNTITITRIVLIPVFIIALDYKMYDYALYLFLFASLTDLLDGLFARLKNQRTHLGTFLDPLADKFMLVTSFVFFTLYGWIPAWLTIIVISRDIIVVTGFVLLFFITRSLKVEPLLLGKASIATQFILLCYVLLNVNFGFLPNLKSVLVPATALISVCSGLQYISRELRVFR
jgi:cardiolipin synthase